jgi:F-type H+-transporting ATPase subunit b
MTRKNTLATLLFLPLFLCFSEAEKVAPGSVLLDLLAKSINFILLFGTLGYLLRKPLGAFLEGRGAGIKKSIEDAEQAKRKAEGNLESIRRRLQGLDDEVRKIKSQGEAEGRKEKERIVERGHAEAEKIKIFAQQEIDAQVQAARRELREYAAALAVSLAKGKIEKRLTPDLHSRLVDESIEGLERLHERSDPC